MQTSSEDRHLSNVLALLPFPDHEQMSQQQRRGTACVWDGITLAPDTAVDLGSRPLRPGGDYTWYPRACRRCVGDHALRALHDHAPYCELCVENAAECEVGRVLVRLIREGGRA